MLDLSLFPKKEEWGTGDEAMDSKLSIALKFAASNLTNKSISDFYFFATMLKTRTHNPTFLVNIELVAKALFYYLDQQVAVDLSIKKMKGHYDQKEKSVFKLEEIESILTELKLVKKFRYKNQIDFSINLQDHNERNPFVREALLRSSIDLTAKIIFKDFKQFLNEESKTESLGDPFFDALKGGKHVLVIENFTEIWFHRDQIFSLSLI